MAYLLDTSILGRLANKLDPDWAVAESAIVELHRRGDVLHLTPQNFVEFRNIATRPVVYNGLGMSIAEAETHAATFETAFSLVPDTAGVFPAWKALVQSASIIGKQVHDARLVAVCHVHGITHVLTFNVSDFARMATVAPGLTVVHPKNV
jgi:predicted nucleic acid-binding protein